MYPKQNYEQWLQDYSLYKEQHKFAAEQCAKYEHLISTQSEKERLQLCLTKWAALRSNCITALQQHVDRALRWQLLNNERHHQLSDEVQELAKTGLIR